MEYQLGHSEKEQRRLETQAKLYDDRKFFHLEKSMNVCEFGCGNGANLWIAEKLQNGKYIGLDSQEKLITQAKIKSEKMLLKNSSFYVTDATHTPVEEAWADLSFCRLVLVHNSDPQQLLTEMARVTKPGGTILAIEPNNLSYLAYNKPFLNKTYHARVQHMYQPGKGTLDVCPQLFHLFQNAGLSEISIKQHSIYYDSRHPEILKLLYQNWMVMLETMKEQKEIISQADYEAAAREASEILDGDSIYQCLWIAEGKKH